MSVEGICWQESKKLLKRSPKYWLLVAKMYGESIFHPKQAKLFRAVYSFWRHIDDVLDGDQEIDHHDPGEYVEQILASMDDERGESPQIVELYQYAVEKVVQRTRVGDTPEEDLRGVIHTMLFDFHRAQERKILTTAELDDYYQKTFRPVDNIFLIVGGSQFRANDVSEMEAIQGHIYSVRDLEKDLKSGICNIPSEILVEAGIDDVWNTEIQELRENSVIQKWVQQELTTYHEKARELRERLPDKVTRKIFGPILFQVELFCLGHRLGLEKWIRKVPI